jgi:FMN phosphatase YigB (HAD superfamily)
LLRILDAGIPICAMTNSDREHGKQVQSQLGFAFTHWFCAEQTGIYKPSRGFWESVSESLAEPYGPQWWHVSAYGDYDLGVAHSLGLTTVFVERPHSRPAEKATQVTHHIKTLVDLADLL